MICVLNDFRSCTVQQFDGGLLQGLLQVQQCQSGRNTSAWFVSLLGQRLT
jgi:hypothetical protein